MRLIDPRNGKQTPLDQDLGERWAKDYADWSRQDCTHDRQELRRGTNKGGHPVIRMQCLDCGQRIGNAVKPPANANDLRDFDDGLHDEYTAARAASLKELDQKYADIQLRRWNAQQHGESYYRQKHSAYLASPEWRNRRQFVMDRSQGLCEGCRGAAVTEVHHVSYEHWGNEFLFELVALCGNCHDRIHAKGVNEALVEGCGTCLHASRGSFCRLYGVSMLTALESDELCTFERMGFEAAN